MLELCALKERQMARIFESCETVGTLKSDMAQALGLPETVRVCAGAGDNVTATVGTATVGDGQCNISLGTAGTIFISSKNFGVNPNNALHAFAYADGYYLLMGCMLSVASCNKWWMEEILNIGEFAAEQAPITYETLGTNRVFFLPCLMGKRSPVNDTNARGTFTGLAMDSTRADMTQAVLEGVAFGIRDSLEVARSLGNRIDHSKPCGGAKSPLWQKIFANILNLDIDLLETEEGPGYGGAILAAVACGEYPSVEDAVEKLAHVTKTIHSNPALAARYEAQYQKYRQIYPAMKALFPALH